MLTNYETTSAIYHDYAHIFYGYKEYDKYIYL